MFSALCESIHRDASLGRANDGRLRLTRFIANNIPSYAILSHTWEADDQEVTFEDLMNGVGNSKSGYRKIRFCIEQADRDGLQYFWVDSCCINKSSSAELSEAINSMFRWYRNAAKCYVYLSDVAIGDPNESAHSSQLQYELAFRQSRWFTRGWTLQELLAPASVEFFSREGNRLGDKKSLELQIHEITGIAVQALQGSPLSQFSVSERMSWAAKRETTIEEDQAYCLLGIFDTHLPLIYGEGMEHAFHRLRKEIFASDVIETPRDPPRLTDVSAAEKTDACLGNLAASDQTRFLSQTLNHSKHACTWILKNQKYISWHESNKSSLLWITAKAGCGKTTMAAHISQMVSTNRTAGAVDPQQGRITSAVLCFFFQKSNQEAEKTALAALRTITSQLVHQVPQILPILLKRHDSLSARGAFEWSWENLSTLVNEMLAQTPLSSRVYIILDAVDECDTKSRMLILGWVKELVDENAAATALRTSRPILKALVTSRPDISIFDHLSDFPNLAIRDVDTANDIRALIHSRMEELARHRHLNPDVTRSIIRFLEANAHGMFLWVVLVMKELERRDERLSDEVIVSKLSRIPLTLIDTYEAILCNISPTRKQDFWRIIRWLLFGSRSLTLAELETALCLETGVSSWHDFAGDVKFLCGSLIRFDGPREAIDFVHQTARGFFESFTGNSSAADVAELDMDVHAANERLATICVQYLLREEFLELIRLKVPIRAHSVYVDTVENFLRRYPFLRYVIESWAFHIRAVRTPSPVIFTMVRKLLSSTRHREFVITLTYFINHHGSWNAPTFQTPLHLAAYFDFPWLVESYISHDRIPVDAVGQTNDTPLIWASEKGSTESVKKLLDAGADPTKLEYDGWSALHWAARNGHPGVAKLLLKHGARLDKQDSRGHTPLDWALDGENRDIVKILKRWADKNKPPRPGDSSQQQDLTRETINIRPFRIYSSGTFYPNYFE